MAQRHPLPPSLVSLGAFGRAFDELFEELLISPWRGRALSKSVGQALVLDLGTDYEVRIPATKAAAEHCDIEVSDHRLTVRMPAQAGVSTSVFDFSHPIETEGVKARLVQEMLHITLPKKRLRKIKVQ